MASIPMRAVQECRGRAAGVPSTRGALAQGDARWVLAARACLAADKASQIHPDARARLSAWATGRGVAPIHAAAIIAIAEMAAARGGLTPDDAARIAALPEPGTPRSGAGSARALAAVIAVLAAVAVALAMLRLF